MGNRNIVDKDMITWHTDTEKISAVQSNSIIQKSVEIVKISFSFHENTTVIYPIYD